jgi:hypothetical protein
MLVEWVCCRCSTLLPLSCSIEKRNRGNLFIGVPSILGEAFDFQGLWGGPGSVHVLVRMPGRGWEYGDDDNAYTDATIKS